MEAPILALPDSEFFFFEIDCDASNVGAGAVLSQKVKPIIFYSEKLNGSPKNYSTYDKEFMILLDL